MSNLTVEQCEQRALAALDDVRAKLSAALTGTGKDDNVFSALGHDLHVDQARQLIADSDGAPQRWTQRDGKRTISTATDVDRGMLSIFVGGNRFLPTEAVFLFFADILGGKSLRNTTNLPGFLNLFVLEGLLHPDHDLAIWVTVAHQLATGKDEDLHAVLPQLHTDFDLFHQDLPAAEEPSRKLRPSQEDARPSWPAYQMQLLGEVLPDLQSSIVAATTDEERQRLFASQEPRLRAYVREQLFARLASALEAAGGRYARLYPVEE